jgi:ribonuclease
MQNKTVYKLIIVLLLVLIAVRFIKACSHKKNTYPVQPKQEQVADTIIEPAADTAARQNSIPTQQKSILFKKDIDELTKEAVVVPYVKQFHRLPRCYITKKYARKRGWDPAKGNLCEVLPGRAIGGDRFTNREGRLPEKPRRKWYEADLNYNCAHRNADRLLFSNDGLVFVTKDHYKTFAQQ